MAKTKTKSKTKAKKKTSGKTSKAKAPVAKAKKAKKPAAKKSAANKTANQVPMVEYLKLGAKPYLSASECKKCGARYFDRRNACASCGTTEFKKVRVKSKGKLQSFTIVHYAAPGVEVPFVAGLVDCDGTTVRGNIIGVEPVPENIELGMNVELATYSLGVDTAGTECIGFGFQPA